MMPVNPLKDESNPTSVINLVPTVVAARIKAIPDDVFDLEFDELAELAKAGENERKMRVAFWLEYERAIRTASPILVANVYKGVCNQSNFYNRFIVNSYRLAYILTPPEDYSVKMEEMLLLAMNEERKILETPIKQVRTILKDGKEKTFDYVDSSLAMVKHKIRESIQNRLQGMPVHRSMQITHTSHSSGSGMNSIQALALDFDKKDLTKMSDKELKAYVQELKGEKLAPVADGDEAIDITPALTGAKDGK